MQTDLSLSDDSGVTTSVIDQIPTAMVSVPSSQSLELAVNARAESPPVDYSVLDVTTFTTFFTNHLIPSTDELKNVLLQRPNPWANCTSEELYNFFGSLNASIPRVNL